MFLKFSNQSSAHIFFWLQVSFKQKMRARRIFLPIFHHLVSIYNWCFQTKWNLYRWRNFISKQCLGCGKMFSSLRSTLYSLRTVSLLCTLGAYLCPFSIVFSQFTTGVFKQSGSLYKWRNFISKQCLGCRKMFRFLRSTLKTVTLLCTLCAYLCSFSVVLSLFTTCVSKRSRICANEES
jgi:hypothetical protein